MRRLFRVSVAIAVGSLALAGCSDDPAPPEVPQSAQPEDSDSGSPERADSASLEVQNTIYLETVEEFPYELPEGYEFPESVPEITWYYHDEVQPEDAEGVAYIWWGCAKLDAAWDAYEAGDQATADQHYQDVQEAVSYPRPGLDFWAAEHSEWGENRLASRGSGETGYCTQWLSLLDMEL